MSLAGATRQDGAPSNDNGGLYFRADAMRALLTFGSLLIVLAIISITVRNQLHASKRFLPAAAAASGVAPLVVDPNNPQRAVSQYQRELDQAMRAGAQHTADQAASAADEGTR